MKLPQLVPFRPNQNLPQAKSQRLQSLRAHLKSHLNLPKRVRRKPLRLVRPIPASRQLPLKLPLVRVFPVKLPRVEQLILILSPLDPDLHRLKLLQMSLDRPVLLPLEILPQLARR